MEWYYSENNESVGPVTENDFQQLVADGKIAADTLVWHEGMTNWVPYGRLTDSSTGKQGYVLKEMGLGEILDQAVDLLKNHFKLFFLISCYMSIPLQVIYQFIVYGMAKDMATVAPGSLPQLSVSFLIITMVFLVLSIAVVSPLTNGATIAALSSEYLGRRATAGESLRFALKRFWPLIGTSILAGILICLGFLLIIPGIILAFRYWFTSHVVIIERAGGSVALKRSGALMKGNMGKAFVLGLLVIVISLLVQAAGQFVPVQQLAIVVQILLQTTVFIFTTAAGVVFYFSCRCKYEHFDLTVLAESMEKDANAVPSNGRT